MKTIEKVQSKTDKKVETKKKKLDIDEAFCAIQDCIELPSISLENEWVRLRDSEEYEEYPMIKLRALGSLYEDYDDEEYGDGGVAYSITVRGVVLNYSKGYSNTTQERLELLAIINGLEQIRVSSYLKIYTESKNIINAISLGDTIKWAQNYWKTEDGLNVKNRVLWQRLLTLLRGHQMVSFSFLSDSNERE